MSKTIRALAVATLLAVSTEAAFAGGPVLLCDPSTGTPFAYADQLIGPDVTFHLDAGPLGPLTNLTADLWATVAWAEWSGVATSYFDTQIGLDLIDITLANAGTIIGTNRSGRRLDVIYDHDGTIISTGFGAPPGVLGIASPDFGILATCALDESWAVINGLGHDLVNDPTGAVFAGVMTHEFGHAINLAHSQTNGAILFFGDATGPEGCGTPWGGLPAVTQLETMYPFIDVTGATTTGQHQATVEQPDDIAAISNLMPAPGWPPANSTIKGTILFGDGSEATGINVIARNIASPFGDAVSALSGDHSQGSLGPDGAYTFNGLNPAADYVVYADAIVAGGFSTPVYPFPFPEEYFDTGESATDDPCVATLVKTSATARVIILNTIFADGFESGDTSAWSTTVP